MTYSIFENPRKGWNNIDILYTEEGRKKVESIFPDIYPLLDWPELRAFFDKWEKDALELKRRSRLYGLAAVVMSILGLSILAFIPWIAGFFGPDLLILAGICVLGAGIILGLWMRFVSSATRKWLVSRFWAERTRQFQFQYIVSHLNLLADAMKSETGRSAWVDDRSRVFRQFAFRAGEDPVGVFENVVSDDIGQEAWLESSVGLRGVDLPPDSPERIRIIDYLKQLRVGYQLQYARSQNRSANIYSKKGLAAFAAQAIFLLIAAFVLITFGIGAYVMMGGRSDMDINLLFGIQGFLAAMIAGMRVIEEGLGWRAEASRYIGYEAGLVLAEAKLRSNSDEDIASGLVSVEDLAYQELRGFLIAHLEPRFII